MMTWIVSGAPTRLSRFGRGYLSAVPVWIAVLVATVVVTTVSMIVTRSGRAHDPADVTGGAAEHLLVENARRHAGFRQFLLVRRDPRRATGLALTVALALVAAASIAVGWLLQMVEDDDGFAEWDMSAARWGADQASSASTHALKWITTLGSTPFVLVALAVVGIVEYRRLGTRAAPMFLATVVASELVINNLIKAVVERERPTVNPLVSAHGFSFPSGHTAATAASYAAIALLLGRRRSVRAQAGLAAGAVGLTVAVASSRVLLGAHWLTDVMAGAALGWGIFALCSIAYGGRLLHFGQPIESAQEDVVAELHDATRS